MAQQQTLELLDDVDGSPASTTVTFSLGQQRYEIDLNDEHAHELRRSLDTFIQHARVTNRGRHRKVSHQDNYKRTTVRPNNQVIRSWAQGQGLAVSAGGRLSRDVIARYEAAH